MLNLTAIGAFLTIILALIAMHYSYRLSKKCGELSRSWLYITLGMATLAVHRCIVFIIDYNSYAPNDPMFLALKNISFFAFFLTLILLVYGFRKLAQMVNDYNLVKIEILQKIRDIDRKIGGKGRKK